MGDEDAPTMKAVAILPGKPDSIHLRPRERRPTLDDVPGGSGVLVDIIRVGVDGTDKELIAGLYGKAPEGEDHLITGHENLGRVTAAGPDVPSWLTPGLLVVSTVRRPGRSIYDLIGMQDMTTDEEYLERGINRLHGFLAEAYVEDAQYLVPVPEPLEPIAVLLEPLTIAEKAIRQAFEIQRRLRVWHPERAAVLGAGTIGLLTALAMRLRGMDVSVYSRRAAPYRNSELLEQIGVRYVSATDTTVQQLRERHGPFDLMLDASGSSALMFQAAMALASNGVMVLASITGGDRTAEVPTDRLNQSLVLANKVLVGVVNASRDDFVEGVSDLLRAVATYPGWLEQLLTTPIAGLEDFGEMARRLRDDKEAIKVFVEVAAG
jgi:threonine dehydrogenase-like Zn-dependent dehydrogenase